MKSLQKILIANIFGIGDVLFTTPLIANIKAHNPQVQIGYICNRRTESLLANHPKINRVFVYERDEFNRLYKESKFRFLKKTQEFLSDVKKEQYDMLIDISLSGFIGFFASVIGIKRRIGFDYKQRGRFLTERIVLKGYENKHVVEYYLDLLELIDVPIKHKQLELFIDDHHRNWADEFLRANHLNERDVLIGVVPGGGASWGKDANFKRWPAAKYAKLADKLIENTHAKIILMGDSREEELCRSVEKLMTQDAVMACGQTTIHQFAALAQRCRLMIVNDGGPLHIAVAAQARTVSIFGPVDERVYGPYPSQNHRIVARPLACRPCYRQFRRASCDHVSCLNLIEVDEVFEKVKEIL